ALGSDPVSEHGAGFTIFCPAFPELGRSIYKGYLFVGDVLLSESGMRDHPLTPMRDPSLVRVLQRQCRGKVGLVQQVTVARGAAAVLSGSCSQATQAQVAYMRDRAPIFTIDPVAAAAGRDVAREALDWAVPRLGDDSVLISATAPPDQVAAVQQALGRERAGALVESILAEIARGLVARG